MPRAASLESMYRGVLRWYKQHGRPLPWRSRRDPYRVLVSEIMLQQTQVDRVLSRFEAWLKRFPNWNALARARRDVVLRHWLGLGYNRRALALREIAREVTANGVPATLEDWLELPGVGPYTARAVLLFTRDERVLPIDTNIRRVLTRFWLGSRTPREKDDARFETRALAEFPRLSSLRDIVYALFDIGALLCKPRKPECELCPLAASCRARASGKVRWRPLRRARERLHQGKRFPDRIYRGRIVRLLHREASPLSLSEIAKAIDPSYKPKDDRVWVQAMLTRLVRDGLVTRRASRYSV